ncbi:hypothetical protein EYF80_022058 [Liparis tanakae]|uniref:Uncharacterized protein n=1 Tax=Liparis tanakae TaxID=230148 RepID=A0A4Z2HSE6_9TELE|nr:hypothetical protein EYF80_022058 [Liparis tanakae]
MAERVKLSDPLNPKRRERSPPTRTGAAGRERNGEGEEERGEETRLCVLDEEFTQIETLNLIFRLLQCCGVADDDGLLAAGCVPTGVPPVKRLSDGPGRGGHLGPVLGDVLMVRILGALQLLGANVAEHDAKREEAEHADHQEDVHHALGLSVGPGSGHGVHGRLRSGVVVQRWRQEAGAVEAVLQEGEQQRLQLGGVDVRHA